MRSLHHNIVRKKKSFVIAILKVEKLKEAFSHFQMDSIVLFPEKSRKTSWHERYFRAKWNFLHQTPQISPIPSKIIFPKVALRKYCKRKVSIEFLWGVEPCIGLLASSNDWFQQLGLFLDFSHFLQGNLLREVRIKMQLSKKEIRIPNLILAWNYCKNILFWQNYYDCTCSFNSISPTEFSSKKGRKNLLHFQHSVNMHCLDDFR